MIRMLTGPVGMGKTLTAAMDIFDNLCRGCTVVTNIDVDWEEMCRLAARRRGVILVKEQFWRVNPEEDKNWEKHIPFGSFGAFVECYWDEAHLFYNARDHRQTDTDNRSMLSFLSQSRKACVNVTFIVQSKDNVEKQFRELSEWEYAVISSKHIPFFIFQMLPPLFFKIKIKDMRTDLTVSSKYLRYDKAFFRTYRSFSMLDKRMKELAESTTRVVRVKLKRISFWRRVAMDIHEPFRIWAEKLRAWKLKRKAASA